MTKKKKSKKQQKKAKKSQKKAKKSQEKTQKLRNEYLNNSLPITDLKKSEADRAFAPVASSALDTFAAPDPARGFQFRTVGDFAEAYRAGRLTPEDVARRVTRAIQATEAGDRPLRAIIASEAADLMEPEL